jgi:hypothetical protein
MMSPEENEGRRGKPNVRAGEKKSLMRRWRKPPNATRQWQLPLSNRPAISSISREWTALDMLPFKIAQHKAKSAALFRRSSKDLNPIRF